MKATMRANVLSTLTLFCLAALGLFTAAPRVWAQPVPAAERIPVDIRRTTFVVHDIDKSLALYRDALGLTLIYDQLIGGDVDSRARVRAQVRESRRRPNDHGHQRERPRHPLGHDREDAAHLDQHVAHARGAPQPRWRCHPGDVLRRVGPRRQLHRAQHVAGCGGGDDGAEVGAISRMASSAKVRIPYFEDFAMLAKITSKNQLTLPKSVTASVGPAEYFDVQARDGQIILTPVRIQRGDAVRAKLAELGLGAADITAAVRWARKA